MAGTVLVAQPVMMALFSPFAGRLSDRVEPRIISSIGMAITCLGLLYFTFVSQGSSLVVIVVVLMSLGFGFALFSSPNMNAIMGSVERRYLGIASGSVGTMRVLGQMFSMGIAMLILSLYVGGQAISADLYPDLLRSIRLTFGVFSVLCVIGIFASLARGDIHSHEVGK
jgi:MFS family permease